MKKWEYEEMEYNPFGHQTKFKHLQITTSLIYEKELYEVLNIMSEMGWEVVARDLTKDETKGFSENWIHHILLKREKT